MAITVKDTGGKDFQIPDPGTYPGVCTWLISLGPQPSPWGAKEKLKLRFEIPSERVTWEKDGVQEEGPMVMWATYTASLSEKAILRRDLESWRGRPFTEKELAGFNMENIVGAPCLLSISHRKGDNGRTYADISSIAKLMKGQEAPKPEGETVVFDIRDFNQEEYDALPEWLQKRVDDGLAEIELQEKLQAEALDPDQSAQASEDGFIDDDIPF